jgi:hypothetical protein
MCLGQDCECFNCRKAKDQCSEHFDCEDTIEYDGVCCDTKMDCPDYAPIDKKPQRIVQ